MDDNYFLKWLRTPNVVLEAKNVPTPEVLVTKYYCPGTKFYLPDSKEPHYVVGYFDDKIKMNPGTVMRVVLYKTWNPYDRTWEYGAMDVAWFLTKQSFLLDFPEENKKPGPIVKLDKTVKIHMWRSEYDQEHKNE